MRDQALERAIGAAGGVRALARAVGVSQPAISSWKRVPADRVLSVETLTGISRSELRPDLYPHEPIVSPAAAEIDEIDAARADEFELIGALLWRAPTIETLTALQGLRGDASPLGMAHLALAEAAAEASPEQVRDEFFQLFIGVGRGELLPYASYYLTGFLHERPLALVREDMGKLGLARAERVGEPEDHVAVLMDIQAKLIRGEVSGEGVDEASFFARHIRPWADRFFADLETTPAARFYRAVGRVGSLYLSIETQAASLPA
ncbi:MULTISPECIES: Cro/CI family transcriptional regulator [unclassified Bosea (in: a-proteobacteria)]|uniref:Cro/CI family transcriptional regulator n=1 Tax=unclassified Bosea (in: a-proteobacteria) TaxID=2653178 RepID=UPI000F7514B5|nr:MULTISPECIES: Cro/CI family transcriptional regulator [unclassified Bosea (in: a-proteobacteria)]AZO78823.1 molecular chaperone [Bosea sp. Tri-49]RXT17386.1 molecular chaperone [Bosea sp. Tri-39]RXT40757.1 molecular chaperone [Bosea sp. Tri-54]